MQVLISAALLYQAVQKRPEKWEAPTLEKRNREAARASAARPLKGKEKKS